MRTHTRRIRQGTFQLDGVTAIGSSSALALPASARGSASTAGRSDASRAALAIRRVGPSITPHPVRSGALSPLRTPSTSIPAADPHSVVPQATRVVPQTTATAGMPPFASADFGAGADPARTTRGTAATAADADAHATTGGSPSRGPAAVATSPRPLDPGPLLRRRPTTA